MRDVRSTRAMRGAKCCTDHFMIRAKCNKTYSSEGKKVKTPQETELRETEEPN